MQKHAHYFFAAVFTITTFHFVAPMNAVAQTEVVLHNFTRSPDAEYPNSGLVRDAAGNLYGTTTLGGGRCHCGAAYQLTHGTSGWTESVIYQFNGRNGDGEEPYAGLIADSLGNLYGTTVLGGTFGFGTVFELSRTTNGWTESVLYNFKGGNDGGSPFGGVVFDHSGNLYGTTTGDYPNRGTVFELKQGSGGWTESVLYAFLGGDDGSMPYSTLVFDPDGNLFGTTTGQGNGGPGNVFELSPAAGGGWTESVVYRFSGNRDGGYPIAGLVRDAAGNLFGTTNAGGTNSGGTVFELTYSTDLGWVKHTIHNFKVGAGGAGNPYGGVTLDSSGNVYGTTCCDGSQGSGTVFQLAPVAGGWSEKVLRVLNGRTQGGMPTYGSLLIDSTGNVYGTTNKGGAHGAGTVFELTPTGSGPWAETVLHSFSQGIDGMGNPYGKLVIDSSGNIYGTSQLGGVNGLGSIFQLTQTAGGWKEKILHSFAGGADGFYPLAGVALDSAGNLFGTTIAGGSSGKGTVYQMSQVSGTWKKNTLYSFTGGADGGYPTYGGLALDSSGNLYGTTAGGGALASQYCVPSGCGTVFKLTKTSGSTWTETVLYAFNGGADGSAPQAGVVLDGSGNLYGTTLTTNGGNGYGVIYKLTPGSGGWTESVLYSSASVAFYSGVVFDGAGNLYGAAGDFAYQLTPATPSWNFRVLYFFRRGNDGAFPTAGVTLDSAGNVYGTATKGGIYNGGLVFKLTASQGFAETVLHNFGNGADGNFPDSDLISDSSGNLYGATILGGSSGNGMIFEITP